MSYDPEHPEDWDLPAVEWVIENPHMYLQDFCEIAAAGALARDILPHLAKVCQQIAKYELQKTQTLAAIAYIEAIISKAEAKQNRERYEAYLKQRKGK